MFGRILAFGKKSSGFYYHVHAQIAPRQFFRLFLRQHWKQFFIHLQTADAVGIIDWFGATACYFLAKLAVNRDAVAESMAASISGKASWPFTRSFADEAS